MEEMDNYNRLMGVTTGVTVRESAKILDVYTQIQGVWGTNRKN